MPLLLWLWQLPQTSIGFIYYTCITNRRTQLIKTSKVVHTSALRANEGVSLGKYVFVGINSNRDTVLHELGHTVQSAYYGIFYLPLIGLPSIVRAMLFKYQWKRGKWHNKNYYGVWFERQASLLGYMCFTSTIS